MTTLFVILTIIGSVLGIYASIETFIETSKLKKQRKEKQIENQ
ncbi:MAG: hypothetical protein QM536_08405 [Chitinophagaceae bacterium]|nr:hypothetical protein [Chitinophagaceae bacterium]